MTRRTTTILIWVILLGFLLYAAWARSVPRRQPNHVTVNAALGLIDDDRVTAYHRDALGIHLETTSHNTFTVPAPVDPRLSRRLAEADVPYVPAARRDRDRTDTADVLLWIVLVTGGVLAFYYFIKKRSGLQINNILALRASRARTLSGADKAKFTDIGGNRDAIETLADVVDFLRSPKPWQAAGTRLPRGILLVGPPGTGKTLLARAIAGETEAAFFYTSAAEFVEMFVGVGAARVRDTFEQAVAQQPAIVFIDELDAVGRRRGSGFGMMHQEREQTLNQLLVLMDGLEHHDHLVVMAATNRPDILDPALLRRGRFDRVVRLAPPAQEARVDILRIHTRNKPLDNTVSLERVARRTEGFTGADLEALTNDAALLAVRRNRNDPARDGRPPLLTMEDFDRALSAMTKSTQQFDLLDSLVVDSVSQFSEPTGRVLVRLTLTTGTQLQGRVLWMNATHIKLQVTGGADTIVAKDMIEQLVSLEGTESAKQGLTPDRWAGHGPDTG